MSEPVLVKSYNVTGYELCDAQTVIERAQDDDSLSYVNRSEVLRYTGVSLRMADMAGEASGQDPYGSGSGYATSSSGSGNMDLEALSARINECIKEAETELSYKVCYKVVDITWKCGRPNLPIDVFGSKDLGTCLKGCKRAVLMAATIGTGFDRLIAKYDRLSPAKALIMQALGAERVEALCDRFCRDLTDPSNIPGVGDAETSGQATDAGKNGPGRLSLRPRFSPGYGDLPLEVQKEFIPYLDCNRLIGITLNESLLMSPSKSVTAIVGIEPGDISDPAGISESGMNMIKQGNKDEGMAELERAFSLGYSRAALYLGDMYAKNSGPNGAGGGNAQKADIMEAYRYYSAASEGGVKEAKQRISYILPSVDAVSGHKVGKWFDDPVGSIQEQIEHAKAKKR